jgi:hypothetical protein
MIQSPPPGPDAPGRSGALDSLRALRARADALGPTLRGMLWTIAAGLLFSVLNASVRAMALELDSYQTQFLRYLFGLLVMPLVLHPGSPYRPNDPQPVLTAPYTMRNIPGCRCADPARKHPAIGFTSRSSMIGAGIPGRARTGRAVAAISLLGVWW